MTDMFTEYDWREMGDNSWNLIAENWMLITAGNLESWNTMTASWGGFGRLWSMDVVFAFVRPTRHTFGFMESAEGFTLSFFGPGHRKALEICGSTSGRDTDKEEAAGLRARAFSPAPLLDGLPRAPGQAAAPPPVGKAGRVSFEEARLVLSCRKVYAQDLDPSLFLDPGIADNYPEKDWHRLYVGAIEKAWKRDA